jgi:hypothetical protein
LAPDERLLLVAEQLLQAARIMIQKVARDGVMLGVFVRHLGDAAAVALQDSGARVREQDRRVRGDDELRRIGDQVADQASPGWRKPCDSFSTSCSGDSDCAVDRLKLRVPPSRLRTYLSR